MSVCSRLVQRVNKFFSSHLSSALLFCLLLVLPTQLGIHFWPDFAYINGLRVDYLSPTIFLTDIFICGLFVFAYKKFFKELRLWQVFIGFILVLGIFFSLSPFAGWYGFIKLLEFVFVGWYISDKTSDAIRFLQISFPLGICVESVLAIWQFILQHSVGGWWYFLGERTFSSSTPGVANVSLNHALVLRPYATFPHPNVLAGYLLIGLLFLGIFIREQVFWGKIIYGVSLALGGVTLFLTLSRTAIILGIVLFISLVTLGSFKKSTYQKVQIFFGEGVGLVLLCILLLPRFSGINITGESLVLREKLIEKSWHMLLSHPLLGTGLNNFLVVLSTSSSGIPIQPVHNIYLLVASQVGILGIVLFLVFLVKTCRRLVKKPFEYRLSENTRIFVLSSMFVFLAVGFLDHYFLTLQQGQLLSALIFGLAWTRGKN